MDQMVDAYLDGCEVVYGVRADRRSDSFFKRFTAQSFYKFLAAMGAEVVYNHADYRLVSARASSPSWVSRAPASATPGRSVWRAKAITLCAG